MRNSGADLLFFIFQPWLAAVQAAQNCFQKRVVCTVSRVKNAQVDPRAIGVSSRFKITYETVFAANYWVKRITTPDP